MMNFDIPPADNQQKKVVDATQGDAVKQERATARMEAMRNGTLAEFDAAEAMAKGEVPEIKGPVDYRAGNPDKLRAAQEKMKETMQGAPKKEILYTKPLTTEELRTKAINMRNHGDTRTEEQIIASLNTSVNMGHDISKIGETEN